MLQWLLHLGVSYDTVAVTFEGGGSDNTVFVKIDTLSPGDLCKVVFFTQKMCYKYCLPFLGFGVAVLASGLLVRCSVTFLAVLRSGLNLKEQIFVSLAWIPKATVQVKYKVE